MKDELMQKILLAVAERPALMKTAEVARLLGISAVTVKKWVRAGRLPLKPYLIAPDGKMVFCRTDVEAMLLQMQGQVGFRPNTMAPAEGQR